MSLEQVTVGNFLKVLGEYDPMLGSFPLMF